MKKTFLKDAPSPPLGGLWLLFYLFTSRLPYGGVSRCWAGGIRTRGSCDGAALVRAATSVNTEQGSALQNKCTHIITKVTSLTGTSNKSPPAEHVQLELCAAFR